MITVEQEFKTTKADDAVMRRYGAFGAWAEAAVISAMMMDQPLALLATRVLRREYFLLPSRRAIFHALSEIAQGDWAEYLKDPIRIVDTLRKLGYEDVAKDPASVVEYIGFLTPVYITGANAGTNFISWCEQIMKAWARRRVASLSEKAMTDALSFDKELEEVYDELETAIRELRALGARTISRTAEEIIREQDNRPEDEIVKVVPTGFKEWDRLLKGGGMQRDDFNIFAARPYDGKTTLSTQVAMNTCARGGRVLIFPLEVSDDSTINRMVDLRARISFDAEADGTLSEEDYWNRRNARAEIAGWDLRIVKKSVVTIPMIWKEVTMVDAEKPLDLIVIDHLGLITSDRKFEKRYDEIGYFSRNLKLLCSEKKIPIICPHQVNREGEDEAKKGKRIEMKHLRYSGDVEQDADNIFIIQPADSETDASYELELTAVKIRKARGGLLRMRFDKALGRFDDVPESSQRGRPLRVKRASKGFKGVAKGDPSNAANDNGTSEDKPF